MKYLFFTFIFFNTLCLFSQTISGKIRVNKDPVSFANIFFEDDKKGSSSDINGVYTVVSENLGVQLLTISAIGMQTKKIYFDVKKGMNKLDIELNHSIYDLNQIVVTGTKTFKRKIDSPVIVDIISSKKLQNIQACNLADGLSFSSGMRVENDCQTCNYTQLRMNGLSGSYSQILINGRPIISPLTGLYGLEQIPSNMINRIEVVNGGGSSLYGSSAIGGVVNVITNTPQFNKFSLAYDYNNINKQNTHHSIYGNVSVVNKNIGVTFFINNNKREAYDHNFDNFSELPEINYNGFGANLFLIISEDQKLDLNFGSINEYRYGGEITHKVPHLAMQSEERNHDVLMGSIEHNINFSKNKSSISSYFAIQQTKRDHYTGVRPDPNSFQDTLHLNNPPYGNSYNLTSQIGFQFDHRNNKLMGTNVITIGSDYTIDNVRDEILAFNYLIDQNVKSLGVFLQSDWQLNKRFNFLFGTRFDKHSSLEKFVTSPRFSFLYNLSAYAQFRASLSSGFRAPQAFDTDLHMSFSGGGVSRIILDENLKEEKSQSYSASFNYDKPNVNYLYGFTIIGFYTNLKDAFFQQLNGEDDFGDILLKKNGGDAIVKGFTIEGRVSLNQKVNFQSALTLQSSSYLDPISYSEFLSKKKEFLKTPNSYGYSTLSYRYNQNLIFNTSFLYTGKMTLLHVGGAPEQENDDFKVSKTFKTIDIKTTYIQNIKKIEVNLEYSIGVKNITNDYQNDFDTLKNRDSNYVYGPRFPRTFYFSLILKSS